MKKKIKNRYSKKTINKDFYGILPIIPNQEQQEEGSQGYVFAPYIMETVSRPSREYLKFMKKYKKNHECCPKCGTKEYTTTLVGYIFNSEDKGNYKDLNICVCANCGDKHTVHDRVKK